MKRRIEGAVSFHVYNGAFGGSYTYSEGVFGTVIGSGRLDIGFELWTRRNQAESFLVDAQSKSEYK